MNQLAILTITVVFLPLPLAISPANRLVNDLLSTYNRNVRPVANQSDVLNVKIRVDLYNIVEVVSFCKPRVYSAQNEAKEQIVFTQWVTHSWNDAALRWLPENYDNLYETNIYLNYLWKPDILVVEQLVLLDYCKITVIVVMGNGRVPCTPMMC